MFQRREEDKMPADNDPCWCGSGKKYKKCHKSRERAELPSSSERNAQLDSTMWERETCFHPSSSECDGKIVRAHSIQKKGGGLEAIAISEEVLTFSKRAGALLQEDLRPKVVPVRIRSASTFSGMCEYHDKNLFQPIEDADYAPSNEQAFLAGYRVLIRELYVAEGQVKQSHMLGQLDSGLPKRVQEVMQDLIAAPIENAVSNHEDFLSEKQAYDRILGAMDYSKVRYICVKLDRPANVMCGTCRFPDYDFQGSLLQDTSTATRADIICVSYVPTSNGGAVTFTWLDGNVPALRFGESLLKLSTDSVPDALIRFAFGCSDNTYWSKAWWNGLEEKQRARLETSVAETSNPFGVRNSKYLVDDGLRVAKEKVQEIVVNTDGKRRVLS